MQSHRASLTNNRKAGSAMATDRVSVVVPFGQGQGGLTFEFSGSELLLTAFRMMEDGTFDHGEFLRVCSIVSSDGDGQQQKGMVINCIDDFRAGDFPYETDLFWQAIVKGIVGGSDE